MTKVKMHYDQAKENLAEMKTILAGMPDICESEGDRQFKNYLKVNIPVFEKAIQDFENSGDN